MIFLMGLILKAISIGIFFILKKIVTIQYTNMNSYIIDYFYITCKAMLILNGLKHFSLSLMWYCLHNDLLDISFVHISFLKTETKGL